MEFKELTKKEQKLVVDYKYDFFELVIPQIIDYKGLTFERPLEGVKIHGFYYFMYLFFFERKRQIASSVDGFILDKMLMKNSITGDREVYEEVILLTSM